MKNITLSAQDETITGLRQLAAQRHTTVNDMFREWADKQVALADKAERQRRVQALKRSFEILSFTSDRKYTREEMNERPCLNKFS